MDDQVSGFNFRFLNPPRMNNLTNIYPGSLCLNRFQRSSQLVLISNKLPFHKTVTFTTDHRHVIYLEITEGNILRNA